jgi:hypothetical protein
MTYEPKSIIVEAQLPVSSRYRTFAASSARLRVPLLGYEGNPVADADQENPTKTAEIQ